MSEHFTVVMTGYNAAAWAEKSFASVCEQKYHAFDVIFMNAQTTDETRRIAEKFAKIYPFFRIIDNETRKYQIENVLIATKAAKPKSVIVTVDTDDWFPHMFCLDQLNQFYSPDVWMTHGTYTMYPSGKSAKKYYGPYPDNIIRDYGFRGYKWQASHLRTWRRELMLKIKEEDMKDDITGDFVKYVGDLTWSFPMLEMSGWHTKYLPALLYVYNMSNPLSERKTVKNEIARIEAMVRARPHYERIDSLG